jgi:hypothetical protein
MNGSREGIDEMNRIAMKYFLILLGFCLLFGAFSAYAREATPDRPGLPVLIFRDMAHAPISLVFTLNDDATATLEIVRHQKDTNQTLWQDSSTITESQLDEVIGLVGSLSTVPDQSWHDKDYTFEFPTADGNKKPLELYDGYQHVDPNMDKTLQKVVQTLLDIRKPFEPLVVFGWSGGFVGRSTQLTIKADGTTIFEDKYKKAVAKEQVDQADVEKLRQLLRDTDFSTYSPSTTSACADCWLYSIAAMTEQGIRIVEFAEVTLESAPQSIKTLVTLLKNLSNQEAARQVTVTPPMNSPTPAATVQ